MLADPANKFVTRICYFRLINLREHGQICHAFLAFIIMLLSKQAGLRYSTTYYQDNSIQKSNKGSFAFANNWDYPAGLIKDDGGKFHKRIDREITKKDTSHLYFTAHCRTNVQGGYAIRYCYAERKAGGIGLSFLDGEPAYASEINVFILEGKFTFTSKIIYPELSTGSKVIYKVTASKLFCTTSITMHRRKLAGTLTQSLPRQCF